MIATDSLISFDTYDPLWLLLAALALDVYVGDMNRLFKMIKHPVVWIGDLISLLEGKLNRTSRSEVNRAIRGFVVVAVIVSLCWIIGMAVAWLGQNYPFGWVLELFLVISLVAQRSLFSYVRRVGIALNKEGLSAGREAVSHIVGRDPDQLDNHGVARAAIESLAENFGDAVVAPVFWYVLFGFPGLLIYKAVNTMDSMIGHKSERYKSFGFTAARLDDILNLIPARLAGLWIFLGSFFVPTSSPLKSLKTMVRDARKHRSPNAGWPEGAMAGALDISLAGPRKYREGQVNDEWIGEGRARVIPKDIKRALQTYVAACCVNAAFVALIAIL
ncbi:Cobalamin biosynthesis protein CobD [Candidatus Terasakiella magnetica]|uniref:Cobalamin biosynthesis protein CobD n=1 Tax=Candidatus Terasakiella magnetica TaxID=1867952 RepID=A0A1C3RGJ5_9PROT|nr:adenosylcobinamide-phosphate synthase CbiB [Candidatus Terasakiella magnetica]SCA56391.1 Cobalamin biosynthesis protein CobD [Candidatus Terasakiella magnetica]